MKAVIGNSIKVYILPDFDAYCDVPKDSSRIDINRKEVYLKPDSNDEPVYEEHGDLIYHTVDEVNAGMMIYLERWGRAIITEVAHASIFPVLKVAFPSGERKMFALQYTRFGIIY